MSDSDSYDIERPVAFCLPYLGGSSREWEHVARTLGRRAEVVGIDLPGFGDARDRAGYSVAEMVAYVADTIRAQKPRRWILVGHSMGAKVAAVLTREIEDGNVKLAGIAGIVTIAGSPASPEPMDEDQRKKMMGWFSGAARESEAQAHEFITSNVDSLDARSFELAVNDVLRTNRFAWNAWLETGSREDWSERVGVLRTPAIVVAGENDPKLGPDAQQKLMLPQFANAQMLVLPNAKHLLPMECSDDIARTIDLAFTTDRYRALIASNRVGTPTREALQSREKPVAKPYQPKALSSEAFETLRAVVDRVIPQAGFPAIDLATPIDAQLHEARGDGWRFAALPSDADAYASGLATLDDAARKMGFKSFVYLEASQQDAMLEAVAESAFGGLEVAARGQLDRKQMRMWFEEVRADAVKAFTLHPQTLARMGYSGIANGGDGLPKTGFARIGVGERESWEPVALGDARA